MKVVIRTDASKWIGSGHVMRCLALADELATFGHDVYFSCLPQQGDMISFVESRGFVVVSLTGIQEPIIPINDIDYSGWLQRTIFEDAYDFIQQIKSADLVVTDHYGIGYEWQTDVKSKLNCHIVAIDDLVREHNADLIIDQTLGRKAQEYVGSARVLAGSSYALLASNFSRYREGILKAPPPHRVLKILVSMGSNDNLNATLAVLKSLVGKVEADFTVLLGSHAPHYHEVTTWCADNLNVMHHDFITDMAELMSTHDIAIGAPGTTSWERACLGLASIVIPLADNQKTVCHQLVKYKAAIALTLNEVDTKLFDAFQLLIKHRREYRKANLNLCDGRGAQRVALNIEQLFLNGLSGQLELCFATQDDIELVYEWQCHPQTRIHALIPSVPTWEEHFKWMTNKLTVTEDYFYLIKDKNSGQALGALRLDRQLASNYLISIFIEPNNYGKGIASIALQMVDAIYPNITLHAIVLKENKASQNLFEKANYRRVSPEEFIRDPIK